jgi:nitrogen fixation/metabolism regulation signal transduction histidine kinase
VARRLAHEVKNPLTPIRLAAERLQLKLADRLEGADSKMVKRASDTIVNQVEALRRMVDAFGDYAREPVLSREPIRLDELVREVVALYQQGEETTQFDLELCPGPGGLAADAGRLRQMLHNLIRNAGQAGADRDTGSTDEGSASKPFTITVESRVEEKEGQAELHLEIRDNGPGFPDNVLERPFEPYVTHKQDGSGLGLAICRKIVSEHDGRIAISNPQAGGARVLVTLPLNQSERQGLPGKSEDQEAAVAAGPRHR